MDIRYQDIITLSDKNKYIVASKVSYQSKEYIYLVDINENTNIKFAEIEKDGYVSILDSNYDKELIQTLIPLFYENGKIDIKIEGN